MTDLDTRRPQFTVGIRGYDRTQVDEYVEYLQRLVTDAEERARDAEAEYVFDAHAAVGPRVAEIFSLAETEARELRERVAAEATEVVSEARTEASAIIDAAERAARETRERTQRDHEAMIAELEDDRDRIRDEAVALELRRAEAVGELGRLRELLGEAAQVVGSVDQTDDIGEGVPPVQLTGPNDETIELPAVAASAREQ